MEGLRRYPGCDCVNKVAEPYRLPLIDQLHLDGLTLANIFQGKVKMWNDPSIVALNPGKTDRKSVV